MLFRYRPFAFSLLFLALGCSPAAEDASAPTAEMTALSAPIVGGVEESGYPAVGAIVLDLGDSGGYGGSICSGTLIFPQWVLTAAHCLTSDGQLGSLLTTDNVKFFMGPDARPVMGNNYPDEGTIVDAVAFYIQPQYAGASSLDVALIRLKEPVLDVEPIAPFPGPLSASQEGVTLTYVGFGVNDGINETGGGVKRMGQMDISQVDDFTYASEFDGQGVCFGDSGGPGIYTVGTSTFVAGVNSAVAGATNPCEELAIHVRVDKHYEWMVSIIDDPPPIQGCLLDKDFCTCDAACQADGSCDESVCPIFGSCEAAYSCTVGCNDDAACVQTCRDSALPGSLIDLDVMNACLTSECANSNGGCPFRECGYELVQCLEPHGGEGTTCPVVINCLESCPPGSGFGCFGNCFGPASLLGRVESSLYRSCMNDSCGGLGDGGDATVACAQEFCLETYTACFDEDLAPVCDPLVPTCAPGYACIPQEEGEPMCVATESVPLGGECDGEGLIDVECVAGSDCGEIGEAGLQCTPQCGTDDDCPEGSSCLEGPAFYPDGLGLCGCIDADGDGTCAVDECDDTNAEVGPHAEELCNDKTDNDCDGDIDESECTEPEAPNDEEEGAEGSEEGGAGVDSLTDDGSGSSSNSSGGCSPTGVPASGVPALFLVSLLVIAGLRRRA